MSLRSLLPHTKYKTLLETSKAYTQSEGREDSNYEVQRPGGIERVLGAVHLNKKPLGPIREP
jgi:hypothetical protein